MKKARYTTGLVLLILLASLIQWPMGEAIIPQDQTISIIDTHDDRFITESGVGIDAWLCHIMDPEMDIVSYLVFRDVEVNNWEPLTNATLRFRTTVTLDFEADSSVTIYGMKFSDLQDEGIINPPFVLSVPYTSASVTRNTSQFSGQQWHEVNVTNIVEELIRSYDWDGDGHAGVETGDSIGFVILGAKGHDTRWFIDYHYGTPELATQLVIHWNHEVPPPVDYEEAEYVEEYGNYTIWLLESYEYPSGPIEYVFTQGTDPYNISYDTVHPIPATPITISIVNHSLVTKPNSQRKLVRLSNGILYAVYYRKPDLTFQIFVKNSSDNGQTWINEAWIETQGHQQQEPSIAVDGDDVLHLVWSGLHDDFLPTDFQIWYVNYTDSWSNPMRISNYTGMENYWQKTPVIAIDSNNSIWVVWTGRATGFADDQVWATNYTISSGTWETPVRISTRENMENYPQYNPSIAVDSENRVHVVWYSGIGAQSIVWHVIYDESWGSVEYIVADLPRHQSLPVIAVDPDDNLHVAWNGKTEEFPAYDNILYMNYTDSWSSTLRISTYAGMQNYIQLHPSISIDADSSIHVVWYGKATGYTSWDVVWGTNYYDSWTTPEAIQPTGQNKYPLLRWARWPALTISKYFITDYNGTIILDNGDPLFFNDTDSVYDWIDTEDPRPTDPDPPGWPETGYFIRFRMRLYYLIIGFGCLFGPILFFAWRRPSGYYILCGAILMLMGIGMLLSIGQV